MPFIRSPHDGAALFYVDYKPSSFFPFRKTTKLTSSRNNETLFFIHGWPMSGRMYEHLMLPLSQTYGIRCIASDRRGFGKSDWQGPEQSSNEISYKTFAQDTLSIIKSIKGLEPFHFVCSSMGCGESLLVYNLMRDEGISDFCKGFIWMGPSLPNPLKSDTNPFATPQEVWDMILDGFRQDRLAFVKSSIGGVFGTQHGIKMSETALEFFVDLVNQADAIAIERCCQILSNYDFTEELKDFGKMEPNHPKLLVLHGAKDQSMPFEAATAPIKEYIADAEIKIIENAAHGLYYTARDEVMEDILMQIN